MPIPTRIVVIGGGFAGMAVISSLRRLLPKSFPARRMVLIDANWGHGLIPELPKVLENHTDMQTQILDYRSLLRGTEVQFIRGRVGRIDRERQFVDFLDGRRIAYDHAVLAVGTQAAFPKIPGLHSHALPARTVNDAVALARRLDGTQPLRVVIIGAGLTGVEVAAGLAHRHEVTLIEHDRYVLPRMPRLYGMRAEHNLWKMGVRVLTQESILQVTSGGIKARSGDLAYDVLVWAGGLKPPDWIHASGIPCDRQGYPLADGWGRIDPHLSVSGDLWRPSQREVPQMAQMAQDMGAYVGRVLAAQLLGYRMPRAFRPSIRGVMVSLGQNRAIGWVLTPPVLVSGPLGGCLKDVMLRRYRWEIEASGQ